MTDGDVQIAYDERGLVPVVTQDAASNEVLMLAYANREAVRRTHETGRAHYYSRSREALWEKGATSGNTQELVEMRVDCDADTLLYVVEQRGGACHTGHETCFHRTVEGLDETGETARTTTDGERVFDPDEVY